MSSLTLLGSRRFGPIFTAMALGAFNDNFYKNAFSILLTYSLAEKAGLPLGVLISIGTACFIIPFFLFSGTAGLLADKYPKSMLARMLKLTELALVICAVIALFAQHIIGMMVILFLLGLQAAFFGPVKYAILPELLKDDELLAGTGLIEAGTFIFILLGTTLGGLLILRPHGDTLVATVMIAVSAIGVIASLAVPRTKAADRQLKVPLNPVIGLWRMIRTIFTEKSMLLPILGISWFWAVGATYLTQLPVFARQVMGGDEQVSTSFYALFSIGVAVGSVVCAPILKRVALRVAAPISLLGVCLFGLDASWVGHHAAYDGVQPLLNLHQFLTSAAHWRVSVDLFLMAVCGGIFTIPLYTRLQCAAGAATRARAIASNNVMNALFIAIGSLMAAACYALQWQVLDVLTILGFSNVPVILALALATTKNHAISRSL